MPRGISNWSYKNVTDFLKHHGFAYDHPRIGSHEAWLKHPDTIVEVSKPKDSYPPLTLKTMIRQSKLDQKHWIKWCESSGQCYKKEKALELPPVESLANIVFAETPLENNSNDESNIA